MCFGGVVWFADFHHLSWKSMLFCAGLSSYIILILLSLVCDSKLMLVVFVFKKIAQALNLA